MGTTNDNTARTAPDETTAATTSGTSRRPETAPEYRGTGIMWSALALVVAIALFVVVALQNMQDVQFDFLWADVAIPLSLILAITFGLALVIGEVIGFAWRHRRRTRLREREELRRLRRSS